MNILFFEAPLVSRGIMKMNELTMNVFFNNVAFLNFTARGKTFSTLFFSLNSLRE